MFIQTICATFCIFAIGGTGELLEAGRVQEYLRETVVESSVGNETVRETLFEAWSDDLSAPDLGFAPGPVSLKCLQCICMKESGCRAVGCNPDRGSLSCGYFQIKLDYWTDCGKPGKDWKSCANDITCASTCVQNYMKRYIGWARCSQTCESYAREHNGGPRGCKKTSTISYWDALQKIKGCKGVRDD